MSNVDKTTRVVGPLDEMLKSVIASVWDEDDPRSVIRIVPDSFRQKMLLVPEDLRDMDESTHRRNGRFNPTINQLRLMFWLEISRCLMDGSKFCLANVFRGICTSTAFDKFCSDVKTVAFIVCPPVNYTSRIYEALDAGLMELRKILDYSDFDKGGRLNTKLLELKMKITMYLDARVNGGFTQKVKIDQRTVSLSMDQNVLDKASSDVKGAILSGDITVIDKKLHELEHRLQTGHERWGVFGVPKPSKAVDIKDISPDYKIESDGEVFVESNNSDEF